MKCLYCGSENLKTSQTRANNQTITAYRMVGETLPDGSLSVKSEPFELSATRRRIKCLNCGKNFVSVEHFERSTNTGGIQQYIISNLTFVNDGTEQMKYTFTQEEKDKINALLREM